MDYLSEAKYMYRLSDFKLREMSIEAQTMRKIGYPDLDNNLRALKIMYDTLDQERCRLRDCLVDHESVVSPDEGVIDGLQRHTWEIRAMLYDLGLPTDDVLSLEYYPPEYPDHFHEDKHHPKDG